MGQTRPQPFYRGRKPVGEHRLSIGDVVCFVDVEKVPVTPDSGTGCLKVVGFDDGYAPNGEYWAIVTRCDDAEFVYAGGGAGTTPYVATWFENLHRCEEDAIEVPEEVAKVLDDFVSNIRSLGYDVDVELA